MKVTRSTLLKIIVAMGLFMIVYSLVRQFAGIGLGETAEKYMFDAIFIGCLGLFMYNRKLAKEEKQAKAAKEEAERQAAEKAEAPPAEDTSAADDEDLPHWERH